MFKLVLCAKNVISLRKKPLKTWTRYYLIFLADKSCIYLFYLIENKFFFNPKSCYINYLPQTAKKNILLEKKRFLKS